MKGILTRNSGDFCFWKLESWALESKCNSRNPVSHQRLESGSQVPLTKNSDSLPGIRNLRLSWIPLNGMLNHILVPSRPRRFRMWRHLSSLSGKFALGSKPSLVTRIAQTGLGTRLVKSSTAALKILLSFRFTNSARKQHVISTAWYISFFRGLKVNNSKNSELQWS